MQSMVTGLVLLCSISQPSSGVPTAKEQYEALMKEFDAADRQWRDSNVTVRPPTTVDLEAWYRASPLWSFVPRFIKLAETNPDDPAAVDALLWVTDLAMQRVVIVQELLPLYGRAVEQGSRSTACSTPPPRSNAN
jgi:hypothetical protein